MPGPLTPTSSQEIIPISPPTTSRAKDRGGPSKTSSSTPFRSEPITVSKTISNMQNYASTSNPTSSECNSRTTTLPRPHTFEPSSELRGKIADHVKADKFLQQIGHVPTPGDSRRVVEEKGKGKGKRKEREEEVERERKRLAEAEGNRERTTQRMVRFASYLGFARLSRFIATAMTR